MAVPTLEELLRRVKASSEKGNLCSQIVVDVGLDHLGEPKPDRRLPRHVFQSLR